LDYDLIDKVIEKLKTIMDLELPINIYDLGLVYDIKINNKNKYNDVYIEITQIRASCSSNKSFLELIVLKVKEINLINECFVKLVFSPKWELSMITNDGLKMLRDNQ
jgi:metal-sulfur cluster biosynthetic enzyme